ncbi:MAG: V-type ATP synthase subunit A [Rhabdochlamydiaceae bacterium]
MEQKHTKAVGRVVTAFGNLLQVEFQGEIRQGEVALVLVDHAYLKAEVIEIIGQKAKIQVFEDTKGVKLGSLVEFSGHLLEAELGPGLLTSIVDGLQNPLESLAEACGLFLKRGVYVPPINRSKHWDYEPTAHVGEEIERGDSLGYTMEGSFKHLIMVPFNHYGKYKLVWVIKPGSYTVDTILAVAVDEKGVEYKFSMLQKWPIKTPLAVGLRVKSEEMMDTGLRTLDTQFPVVKGGSFCSPGPFGAGKTVLQHHLSKYASVDVVVIAACGERAGEVVEVLRTFPHLLDPYRSEPLMNRTVIICNTSSMPVSAREASIYMGATIAEYYRQMGLNVLLLADSTSRWAQALREMSGRLEEIPGEEAFPAYLASRIAAFYERAGVLQLKNEKKGSLTIGGTVSPAGGNFEEPVTQATLAIVGAFHGLSRARSDARRYPAIDPLISWSKYTTVVSNEINQKYKLSPNFWEAGVKMASKLTREGDDIAKRMEVVGEEGISLNDMVTYLKAETYDAAYLQQNAFDKEDAYTVVDRQVELFKLFLYIFQSEYVFTDHDEARSFFLGLSTQIKNLNFTTFASEEYQNRLKAIYQELKQQIKA